VALTALLHGHGYGFNGSDSQRRVLTLCECLRGLNLSRPTFTVCVCEDRSLWDTHVSGDLTKTDTGCIGRADFSPSRFRDFRLTKRKDNSKLTGSKFDSPKRCPDAHHRIAPESFLIAGWQNDSAPDVINESCACFMELRPRKEMAMTAGGSVYPGNPNQP
jgi:hypothetical protein